MHDHCKTNKVSSSTVYYLNDCIYTIIEEILPGRVDRKEDAKKLHEDMVARATTYIGQGYHLMIFASL